MKRLLASTAAAVLAVSTLTAPVWAGTTINVDLWDSGADMVMVDNMRLKDHPDLSKAPMGIKISQATVPAGEVTFKAVNSSKNIEHEMVVASLAKHPDSVPFKANLSRVDENAPNMNMGEISELEPGEKASLTLHLTPGKYLLYCNVAGHYASGMWTLLTVK